MQQLAACTALEVVVTGEKCSTVGVCIPWCPRYHIQVLLQLGCQQHYMRGEDHHRQQRLAPELTHHSQYCVEDLQRIVVKRGQSVVDA